MSHTFYGEHYQEWDVIWDSLLSLREGAQGIAIKSHLEIRLNPNQPLLALLDTAIHEGLHALDWNLEHPFIEHASEELAKLVIHVLQHKKVLPGPQGS